MLSKKISSERKEKLARCKVCRCHFKKWSMTQKVCGAVECAIEWARLEKEKKQKAEARRERVLIQARKEAIKTRSDYMKEAQAAFNAFVRERDKFQSCICCGKPLGSGSVGGGYDCGHYRSVGSAPHMRFNQDNAHAQTKQCNRWGAGRAVDYRIGLIQRIGLAAVEALEADNTPRKYSIDELKQIRDEYRAKLKELKAQPERAAA